jgi:hypothetical protein
MKHCLIALLFFACSKPASQKDDLRMPENVLDKNIGQTSVLDSAHLDSISEAL